ncbi:hypothetical protein NIES2119_06245 [[Phormidium ambiguum] IAM M-71]|uniref:DUF3326 domain-containing protein n=1 Tax=[Phormidium ambiguum] IAM M-71 TaxID=454136 RepID=A0A1U7IPQ6_9CYAN|nr:DUF3326 domain-containing protein [Phormidium ambiguum]OKH39338.1 hypothetical protein NIES2119_06245 [Phormidium ambiguum IAM M-71]
MFQRPYTVVLLVPTGIGAAIGGYAGDALPVARAIASVCDRLITHPNVLNGAMLYWPMPNAFYVEGYALDQFAAGNWGLSPVHQNRIGLILDRAIEPELQLRQLQAADAARATLGLNLTEYIVTDAPLGVELRISRSGISWGTIANPDSLLRAAEKLITQARAEAIAVVARFPEDIENLAQDNYRQGKGIDPIAGAEAVISHLIVRTFQIPCAHAPALNSYPPEPNLSPRSAAEEIGYTFLPCVLVGLSRAPQFLGRGAGGQGGRGAESENSPVPSPQYPVPSPQSLTDIWANQVDALVVPATACGGSATLSFSQQGVQIIAVAENQTQIQVPPEPLGMKVLRVNSYLEALGVLVAHKAGIDPSALSPAISSIRSL